MRFRYILSLIVLAATPVYAEDYFLEIEQSCTTTGSRIEFKCQKGESGEIVKMPLFKQKGVWYGRNPNGNGVWKLAVLKEDKYVLILDNPVLFSGKSIIYIMKPSHRFYWTEFAYSEIMKENQGTVRQGSVLSVNK